MGRFLGRNYQFFKVTLSFHSPTSSFRCTNIPISLHSSICPFIHLLHWKAYSNLLTRITGFLIGIFVVLFWDVYSRYKSFQIDDIFLLSEGWPITYPIVQIGWWWIISTFVGLKAFFPRWLFSECSAELYSVSLFIFGEGVVVSSLS